MRFRRSRWPPSRASKREGRWPRAESKHAAPGSREEVCKRLQQIAGDIHTTCCQFGDDHNGTVNYVKGANIAGFVKVTDEVLECGFSGPNGEQRRS